jgi:hypothetical protein
VDTIQVNRSLLDGPGLLLAAAVHLLPEERRDWGEAMTAELPQFQDSSSRWWFALGCARAAIFPPRNSGMSVAIVAVLSVVATLAIGLAMYRVLPALQVFAVTLVALAGGLATITVARSRNLNLTTLGHAATSALLVGVVGCIAIYAYIAVKYPSAVHDPSQVFSSTFAILLTIYLWLALTPPRALTTSRRASRLGVRAALAYGLVLAVGVLAIEANYEADDGDAVLISLLMAGPIIIALVCSTVVTKIERSFRAGVEAALWAGLIIALLFFVYAVLTPLLGLQIEATVADNFPPGVSPNFDAWFPGWLGGELGGGITSLALVPGWLLFFGLIGGAIGRTADRA